MWNSWSWLKKNSREGRRKWMPPKLICPSLYSTGGNQITEIRAIRIALWLLSCWNWGGMKMPYTTFVGKETEIWGEQEQSRFWKIARDGRENSAKIRSFEDGRWEKKVKKNCTWNENASHWYTVICSLKPWAGKKKGSGSETWNNLARNVKSMISTTKPHFAELQYQKHWNIQN